MIVDNADDPKCFFKQSADYCIALVARSFSDFLPQSLNGSIVITSHRCCRTVQTLDFMPLAITQAAAYISQNAPRITVLKYLHKLRSSDKDRASLLRKDFGDTRRDGTALNSIVATWQVFSCSDYL